MSEARLCYVDGQWAWFTTCPLDKQWGDDWNDAPYEHNAGWPYPWDAGRKLEPYKLVRVAWSADLETPADIAGGNSRYSVEQINAGAIAWLASSSYAKTKIAIPAGTALSEFTRLIKSVGGEVYFRSEP